MEWDQNSCEALNLKVPSSAASRPKAPMVHVKRMQRLLEISVLVGTVCMVGFSTVAKLFWKAGPTKSEIARAHLNQ